MTILDPIPAAVNSDAPADADAPAEPEPTGPETADARWWAEQNEEWDSEPEPDWDARADEAAAVDRLCDGLCC